MNHARRLEALQQCLLTEGHLPFLITSLSDIFYLTGFRGSTGYGLVTGPGEPSSLLCDGRYVSQAREEAGDWVQVVPFQNKPQETIRDIVRSGGAEVLYVEESLTIQGYRKLQEVMGRVEAISSPVRSLRMIKSPEEIQGIQRALALSEAAFQKIRHCLFPGNSERAVALELEYQLRLAGADDRAFPTIVAAGERSALPHARPSSKRIETGEMVVIDWGARLNGYCADVTRTLVIGTPSSFLRDALQAVREAQSLIEQTLRAGMRGREADQVCRNVLDKKGLEQYFTHGLGHGVGIDVHEEPHLGQDSDTILEPGMIVTVEPGLYFPGQGGIRLENLLLIGSTTSQVLNALPAVL